MGECGHLGAQEGLQPQDHRPGRSGAAPSPRCCWCCPDARATVPGR